MILTEDFVYIHLPKTAGTFVAHTLEKIYGEGRVHNVDKHGTCSEIPSDYASLPIVSTLRNPYERYVSQYRFEWWKLHPERYCGAAAMHRLYPQYPDLSFAEFVDLANTLFLGCSGGRATGFENRNFPPERRLGWHSEQLVRFYFRDPRQVFSCIDEDYLAEHRYREDLFPVRFIPVAGLNRALYELLLDFGHEPGDVEHILDAERILPAEGGRPPGERWQDYYTPELFELVRTRERLLFQIFPQFDLPLEGNGAPAR